MSQNQEPLVSVVTPVYNGAEYLRECIESVIAQTYQNWCYTIVNNCSTDGSLEIAQHYARLDQRIRVRTNETFLPIIENHSHAVSLVEPESAYCKPVMADDWIFPECIEKMVNCAVAHPSIGLVCSYTLAGKGILFDGLGCTGAAPTFVDGRSICRMSLLEDVYVFGSPTTMLIRSDLIRKRHPFYNSRNLHADEESAYDVLQESDFGFVHQVLSFFRMHQQSQTSRVLEFDSIFVGRVYALVKYGRVYLTEEEFERRCGERFEQYYSMLAVAALRLRGADFWKYHREKLALIGAPLDRARLLRSVALRAAKSCAAPMSAVRSARTWWPAAIRAQYRARKSLTSAPSGQRSIRVNLSKESGNEGGPP
ncbi:MAG: glycosyltransferase family 2 protein [Candidatus Binataceae bacterium]